MWRPFACRPALFITFFSVDAQGCRFLGSKSVDCHFISFGTSVRTTATSSACSPCLGSFAPNGFLLASIPPHGDIFIRLLATFLLLFGAERLRSRLKNNNISHLTVLSDMILFIPPHGDILFSPPSWRCSIFLRLTATSNFLPLPWHLIGAFRHHANAKQRTGAMMRPRRFHHLPPSRFFPHHGVALLLAFLPGSWISAPSAFTPGHSYSFITPILLVRGHSLPSR